MCDGICDGSLAIVNFVSCETRPAVRVYCACVLFTLFDNCVFLNFLF